jgi:hypothetical protein
LSFGDGTPRSVVQNSRQLNFRARRALLVELEKAARRR